MKNYLIIIVVTCLMVSLSSCEKKDYSSYPPTWVGFQFTRNNQELNLKKDSIFAGDIITITAIQDQKGQLINATTYNWNITFNVQQEDGISYQDSILAKSIHTNYDGTDSGNPSYTFTIPAKAIGNTTAKFSATYAYSGNGIQVDDGGNYSYTGSTSGSIHSTSGNQYGQANGSVRFYVYNKSIQ